MTRPKFALSLVACVVAAGGVVAGPVYAKTHVVRPGHSIQHAINVASPGDTIVVKRGTYHEALLITKDGIRLIGNRAKLVPPATPPNSPCFEGSSFPGICVLGQGNPETNTVTQYVKNVRIAGFTVRGFPGDGIIAFGARRFRVDHDRLLHNHGYGVFSLVSKRVRYLHDLARGNLAPGLYLGDSPNAGARIEHNVSTRNHGEGILLRDSTHVLASHNVLTRNCAGVVGLADAPGPATDLTISHNVVRKNTRECAGDPAEGEPPMSGIGIGLFGAARSLVSLNLVTGNRPSGASSFASGGIVVQRGPGGTAPQNDVVKRNRARHNKPADINWDGSGSVRFKRNFCGTSIPAGLCRHTHH